MRKPMPFGVQLFSFFRFDKQVTPTIVPNRRTPVIEAMRIDKAVRFEAMMRTDCALPLSRFTELLQIFISREPSTIEIEQLGIGLRSNNFDSEREVAEFVQKVCNWGGYPGIGARIIQKNSSELIVAALRNATAQLSMESPDVGLALQSLNTLKDLGQVSFASKHLRFLFPAVCPVLDSIISERMFYPNDVDGYRRFVNDCGLIAHTLTLERVLNPISQRQNRWHAADVEASLYAYLCGWR
jgi:hypothetical protein